MKAKYFYWGAAAVLLVGLGIRDLMNKDANALERVSKAAGLEVDCTIRKESGKRWGVCRYKNDAPASVWLDRSDTWVAANGNAIKVIDRLQSVTEPNLPNVMVDYQSPPTMPASLLEHE
ncbi:hypothetical protein GIW56_22820 [Pseudomonas gessardii]|uniref:Uncharacterized protein n=1 Tax=Pseudomonas gessardii TaxID=78544 RepID=A0ABS9FBJ0_9PSED|nr:hypothetical protein [Pseudomonas gessardii]MCF4980764.1 hypothetical protein [Pseudomonas gessardii]MCF4988483.1 hypothetical protein [Pseudomonas gessardii]MCF5098256.1 hypothetical protein [Pseudomonas gessardii]MCF5098271.1 hypothetical protein [Pseudomonas gessardii]MCF5109667.1 hypothetical protein [Pseudomonas gessardii]